MTLREKNLVNILNLDLLGREPLSISTLMYVGVVCQRRLVHSSFYYSFGSFSLSLKDDGQEKKGKKQKKNKFLAGWMDGWMDKFFLNLCVASRDERTRSKNIPITHFLMYIRKICAGARQQQQSR
jgi:hypothetical protein